MKKRGRPAKPEDKRANRYVGFRAKPEVVEALERIKTTRGQTSTDAISEALLYYSVICDTIDDEESDSESTDYWPF